MRKYILINLLLLTSALLFVAVHKYVEVGVLTLAQAQTNGAADPAEIENGMTGGSFCNYECKKHAAADGRYVAILSDEERANKAACILKAKSCSEAQRKKAIEANQ